MKKRSLPEPLVNGQPASPATLAAPLTANDLPDVQTRLLSLARVRGWERLKLRYEVYGEAGEHEHGYEAIAYDGTNGYAVLAAAWDCHTVEQLEATVRQRLSVGRPRSRA